MPETIFYRLQRSGLIDDGTVVLSVSVYDDCSHSSGVVEIPPTAEDYSFWRWVVGQSRYAKVLDGQAVADARAEYGRFRAWRDGLGGAPPDAEPSKDLSSRSRTSNPLFKKPGDLASEPQR